mgnify:CR=1 FL=1
MPPTKPCGTHLLLRCLLVTLLASLAGIPIDGRSADAEPASDTTPAATETERTTTDEAWPADPPAAVNRHGIRRIAIIPPASPVVYELHNVSALAFVIPLSGTLNHLDSKEKSKLFGEKLKPLDASRARTFARNVADDLDRLGYHARILEDVARDPEDPDAVDYERLATSADAVLHLRFSTVGLYSSRTSTQYVPRVNASGVLVVKGQEDYLYDREIYYGADARAGKSWAIVADEQYAYPTFEAVMSNLDAIRGAFDAASRAIGQRLASQVDEAINAPPE